MVDFLYGVVQFAGLCLGIAVLYFIIQIYAVISEEIEDMKIRSAERSLQRAQQDWLDGIDSKPQRAPRL